MKANKYLLKILNLIVAMLFFASVFINYFYISDYSNTDMDFLDKVNANSSCLSISEIIIKSNLNNVYYKFEFNIEEMPGSNWSKLIKKNKITNFINCVNKVNEIILDENYIYVVWILEELVLFQILTFIYLLIIFLNKLFKNELLEQR